MDCRVCKLERFANAGWEQWKQDIFISILGAHPVNPVPIPVPRLSCFNEIILKSLIFPR